MVWRIKVLFISASVCILFQSVLQFFQRQDFLCVHLSERLLPNCERSCHLSVTVAVPLDDDLRMQFAPLHPHKEGHPGEDLRQRAWQAEAVGEIVIAPRSAF
jgi:hypothetical protein